MARSVEQVHREVCAVAYRRRKRRMEFCLVSVERSSRWEFPRSEIVGNELPLQAACRCLLEQTGFVCRPDRQEPLDEITTTQNRRLVQMVSFLLQVEEPADESCRRVRWCFPEEARARIRRKPMRRLIDLAIRYHEDQAEQ